MIETIIREYGMPWLFNRSLYAAKLKMLSIFPASERLFEKKTGTVKRLDIFDIDLDKINGTSDMKKIQDLKGNPLLLFINSWSVGMTLDRNKGLILSEFGR